ncbi:MAG: LptA/OstA family protein [Elusimicrobiaceae bacterium]|jgi:lipopolysaccharide assembly outer membrane protein LptD (OstA)
MPSKTYFAIALLTALTAGVFVFAEETKPSATRKKSEKAIEKPSFPPVLGGVVSSKSWKMRREKDHALEIFDGNVNYSNPDYHLQADHVEIDRTAGKATARGGLIGERYWPNGNISKAEADSAIYNLNTKKAEIYPAKNKKTVLIHADKKRGEMRTLSDTVYFDGNGQTILLTGDNTIFGEGITTLSKNTLYNYSTDTFELYGGPVVWGTYNNYDFAITGSSAVARDFYDNISFDGNIRGWIRTSTEVYKQYGTAVR